ncbi:NAD(P)/FAD-dependent oxidoreductase [Kordiimonas sp. SCSIO 12610]|uniref:flavin-containing monooxygenase n=1 Tax=Kordiimonas sp. SCSIO 12610 TaxID=2829597 RepID=UPI0021092E6D|nr:NAD(P)/FAD-dependent oxidoreductase [Kordiimonas sp. SCSIO 12610]UTW55697.1 NAD(P)/FAD-dependent oxidoreductase [Kordiimonas sp. SCSIO 12610]
MAEYVEVLIVGAGLSGIGAACHLQRRCPEKSYLILEGRETKGGTWDLFRYPGIRSDSDMYTLGYAFKPWTEQKAIADGPSILKYINETAREYDVDKNIRYGHKVVKASWSSSDARWTVDAERTDTGETVQFLCRFFFVCAGYYDYEGGHDPVFEGREDFKGQIAHPQKWTEDIDYDDKNVVIIGSGATAVTLVPSMADKAKHVTMLQRSPTYIVSRPAEDKLANTLRKFLPAMWAYGIIRWRNVLMQQFVFRRARSAPQKVKEFLLGMVREELGPDYDIDKHFTPKYNPWEERLCLVPDSDLFEAIKNGTASVVTDHIDRFVEDGILLKSGEKLDADLIVTATGLKIKAIGGLSIEVDGKAVSMGDTLNYKGLMFSSVPNFASVFGYTNASWTLKADLCCEYVCRLLKHMDKIGVDYCVPVQDDPDMGIEPGLDFSSGYIQRALDDIPKQGSKKPWRLNQNYPLDLVTLRHKKIDDGFLAFKKRDKEAA